MNLPKKNRKTILNDISCNSEVVAVYQYRPYTCVVLRSKYDGKEYEGFGFSKVCYPDEWSEVEGICRAQKRACINIYKQTKVDKFCEENKVETLQEFIVREHAIGNLPS